MRKIVLNIIETILILSIALVCFVSILQSTFMQDKSVFGYRTYVIASNSMYPVMEYGDVILVKDTEFDQIKIGDVITYYGKEGIVKDKIITHEVIDILEEKDTKVLKTKGRANTGIDPYVYKNQIYGKFCYKFLFISIISKIIRNKIGFVICILIPFSVLFILEFISFIKEVKRKEYERLMKNQLEELNNIKDDSEISKTLEKNILDQLDVIKHAKRDFKKIDELKQTIQIPLEEIQEQLLLLNKNPKEKSKDDVTDDTVILFSNDEIHEALEKDLHNLKNKSTKKVKNKSKKKKQ